MACPGECFMVAMEPLDGQAPQCPPSCLEPFEPSGTNKTLGGLGRSALFLSMPRNTEERTGEWGPVVVRGWCLLFPRGPGEGLGQCPKPGDHCVHAASTGPTKALGWQGHCPFMFNEAWGCQETCGWEAAGSLRPSLTSEGFPILWPWAPLCWKGRSPEASAPPTHLGGL